MKADSKPETKTATGEARVRSRVTPFCLSGYQWVPHAWLEDFPPDAIIRDKGPGKWAMVRIGKSHEVFASPTESKESIHAWTEERHDEEVRQFTECDRKSTGNLFVRASVSKDAVLCLGIKAASLLRMLAALADEGNVTAVEQLNSVASVALASINRIGKEKPELLRPLARRSWKWPVFKSLHPLLSEDHELRLRNLQLGAALPFELHQSARWIFDDAGKIAVELLIYLWRARIENADDLLDYAIVGREVNKLKPFDSDSASDWWTLAEVVLLFSYPKPVEIPELAALVTARSHRKSPGRIKRSILQKLKARFIAFARP